jgi:hypothetical protein
MSITYPSPTSVPCRKCGKPFESATNFFKDRGAPRPGDVLICWGCDDLTVVDTNGQKREPTAKEAAVFAQDSRITAIIAAQRIMRQ